MTGTKHYDRWLWLVFACISLYVVLLLPSNGVSVTDLLLVGGSGFSLWQLYGRPAKPITWQQLRTDVVGAVGTLAVLFLMINLGLWVTALF